MEIDKYYQQDPGPVGLHLAALVELMAGINEEQVSTPKAIWFCVSLSRNVRWVDKIENSFYGHQPMVEIPLPEADWERVKHLFPESGSLVLRKSGRPRRNVRDILDAILWVHQSGEKWHRLPATFPPEQTCYAKFCEWRQAGLIQRVMEIFEISPPERNIKN